MNGSEELQLSGHYEIIGGGGGKNWTFTRETGPASRMAMYNDGISAFMTLVSEKDDGSFVYVGGRKSVWIPFDIPKIIDRLNEIEGEIISEENCWGGSNIIMGSPRVSGSRINPQDLEKIIDSVLSN